VALILCGLLAGAVAGLVFREAPQATPASSEARDVEAAKAPAVKLQAEEPLAEEEPAGAPATEKAAVVVEETSGPPLHPLVDRRTSGQPYGSATGLLMFRGNPTRSWYGAGDLPDAPEQLWRFPEQPMCGRSTVEGETTEWCGTGWTGQPVVWEHDGRTEVIFGAYDHAVHFLDAATGERSRPDFPVGDLVKGSVTLDPDGFPLLYFGSRDNRLRALALDREAPTEVWALNANPEGVWNNDWDGNPVVVDDVLYEGGEDSFFYAVKLNRSYDGEGRVQVDPQVLVEQPGWTPQLFSQIGDRNVSFESSVAVIEGRAYVVNSGGRVLGFDIASVGSGAAPIVFDYWLGDDADATLVIDDQGMIYASVELERGLDRAREVGQLVKLDPSRPDDPLMWSVAVPPQPGGDGKGGLWSTPAIRDGLLYASTHPGELLVVDTADGTVVWREDIGAHEWSSPVIVGDTLVVGECERTGLRGYSLADPRNPADEWSVQVGGCVESTPAAWDGRLYVGSRDGYFYAFGEPG